MDYVIKGIDQNDQEVTEILTVPDEGFEQVEPIRIEGRIVFKEMR